MYVNDQKWEIILCFNKRKAKAKETKEKEIWTRKSTKLHHVNNKRNSSRKLKSFDENNRNRTEKNERTHAQTHTINRLVIVFCLYTKLREEKKTNEKEYSYCSNDNCNKNKNNTCSCLEYGQTPTRKREKAKSITRRNDN